MGKEWRYAEHWSVKGEHFSVEVVRHTAEYQHPGDSEGPNRWNVYAYIHNKHPHFVNFKGSSISQDAASALDFHSGCTFVRGHLEAGKKIHCWQVGSDYHHLYDDRFTHMVTKEGAYEVFDDAERLFDQLTAMTSPSKQCGEEGE